MKKIILILVFTIPLIAFGQISFSCEYREYCDWNEVSEKFEDCRGYEEASLFTMNKDQTMFTHTIESMKSTYYVKNKIETDDDEYFGYDVVSDVGNEYRYLFDFKNEEVKVLSVDENGNSVLIRWYVKSIF